MFVKVQQMKRDKSNEDKDTGEIWRVGHRYTIQCRACVDRPLTDGKDYVDGGLKLIMTDAPPGLDEIVLAPEEVKATGIRTNVYLENDDGKTVMRIV